MKKSKDLKKLLNEIIEGTPAGAKCARIFNLTPLDVHELLDIALGREFITINSNVKKVLDYCGINTKNEGIGWRII